MEISFHCSGFCYRLPVGNVDDEPDERSAESEVKVERREAVVKVEPVEVVVVRAPRASALGAQGVKALSHRHGPSAHPEVAFAEVSAQGRMLLSYDRSAISRTSDASSAVRTNHTTTQDDDVPRRPYILPEPSFERAATALAANRSAAYLSLRDQRTDSNRMLFPPALFSDASYHSTCDGMSARHMKAYAGQIGFQSFYQGIYLVFVAILTGFLKLLGFCMYKDRDMQYIQKPHHGGGQRVN